MRVSAEASLWSVQLKILTCASLSRTCAQPARGGAFASNHSASAVYRSKIIIRYHIVFDTPEYIRNAQGSIQSAHTVDWRHLVSTPILVICTYCMCNLFHPCEWMLPSFVQAYLLGKEWCAEVMSGAYKTLAEDLPLPPDVPGARTITMKIAIHYFPLSHFRTKHTRIGVLQ